jgi:hypothetical protein
MRGLMHSLMKQLGEDLLVPLAPNNTNDIDSEFLEGIVGPQIYSEVIAGAAPSIISALNSQVGDALPTLVAELAAGSVPSVFANIPAADITLAEQIASVIAVLPSDVQAYVEASPAIAAPILSAYEAGVPPPPAAISALPPSIVSALVPIYESLYGTAVVTSYLAALGAGATATATNAGTITGSSTGTAPVTTGSTLATATSPATTHPTTPATSPATTAPTSKTASTTTAAATPNIGGNFVVAGSWLSGVIGVLGLVYAL